MFSVLLLAHSKASRATILQGKSANETIIRSFRATGQVLGLEDVVGAASHAK